MSLLKEGVVFPTVTILFLLSSQVGNTNILQLEKLVVCFFVFCFFNQLQLLLCAPKISARSDGGHWYFVWLAETHFLFLFFCRMFRLSSGTNVFSSSRPCLILVKAFSSMIWNGLYQFSGVTRCTNLHQKSWRSVSVKASGFEGRNLFFSFYTRRLYWAPAWCLFFTWNGVNKKMWNISTQSNLITQGCFSFISLMLKQVVSFSLMTQFLFKVLCARVLHHLTVRFDISLNFKLNRQTCVDGCGA